MRDDMKTKLFIALLIVMIISTLFLILNREILNFVGWYMVKPAAVFPTNGWITSTPEAEGIDSEGLSIYNR